jgi:hypothetical protein
MYTGVFSRSSHPILRLPSSLALLASGGLASVGTMECVPYARSGSQTVYFMMEEEKDKGDMEYLSGKKNEDVH